MANVAFFLPESAVNWLANGERGLSSDQMFETFTCLPCVPKSFRDEKHHPHDPSDFRRCLRLLETVPEFQGRLDEMREVSPTWAKFVDHWDELVSLFKEETVNQYWNDCNRNAEKTYDLIQKLCEAA